MQVKINTSERFHVITIRESVLSANMTEDFENKLSSVLKEAVKNVVLNLEKVGSADAGMVKAIIKAQQLFHAQNASFVVCCIQSSFKEELSKTGAYELLNVAPTESEATDLIMMDEIERELGDM